MILEYSNQIINYPVTVIYKFNSKSFLLEFSLLRLDSGISCSRGEIPAWMFS